MTYCLGFSAVTIAALAALTGCSIPDGGPAAGGPVAAHSEVDSGDGTPMDAGAPTTGLLVTGRVRPEKDSAARITHVMGVSPSHGWLTLRGSRRVVAKVAPDGTFSVGLAPNRLWVLVFVDATKVGSDMIVGALHAKGLATLAPSKQAQVNLGDMTVKDGIVEASVPYEDLLSAMGVDEASAQYLSSVDDICLRMVNPDIDGNGRIDALEGRQNDYRLDFHVSFQWRNERIVSVADIVGAFLPDTVSLEHRSTEIVASFERGGMTNDYWSTMTASFDEELHYTPNGTEGAPGTTRVARPGSIIPPADIFRSEGSAGLMAIPGFDIPQGTHRFRIGGRALTFTNVRTPTAAQLAAAESFIVPFVRLAPVESSCVTACTIHTVDYEWRKRTATGWTLATPGELALVRGDNEVLMTMLPASDEAHGIGFWIPNNRAIGSIPWSSALTDMTRTALASVTTSELCNVRFDYDDKLGTRYFGSLADAKRTCHARTELFRSDRSP